MLSSPLTAQTVRVMRCEIRGSSMHIFIFYSSDTTVLAKSSEKLSTWNLLVLSLDKMSAEGFDLIYYPLPQVKNTERSGILE